MNKPILGKTQIAVIGGGHAGVEAALAAARIGAKVTMFTMRLEDIANLPCNPSIGGSGKGHLVYEIDALGGMMGHVADMTTIQSRTLNESKGPAVHSKRVQVDRAAYQSQMRRIVENTPNLEVYQTEIVDIIIRKGRVCGVVTAAGGVVECDCAIICTGTYANGRVFIGEYSRDAGPDGSLPAQHLSAALVREGLRLQRFKTGTPVRLRRDSLDFAAMQVQHGEEQVIPFSDLTTQPSPLLEQDCHIVYTSSVTHDIIRQNFARSALHGGEIVGTGPRYCPSIEDKITRFADKERHLLFVEPVGVDSQEVYLQGMSTSLPEDVQATMIRSLAGFAEAKIMRPAYAIEYDCINPTQLNADLSVKGIGGLYGAGQFCGTSGYEEAGALGLVAGANAALSLKGELPLDVRRDNSYIGMMIDDLVTKGTHEPYRVMTSRSEYRLLLRQSNAIIRLTDEAARAGLLDLIRLEKRRELFAQIEIEKSRLEATRVPPSSELDAMLDSVGTAAAPSGASLADLLRRPQVGYANLAQFDKSRQLLHDWVVREAVIQIKYAGYISKQQAEVERMSKMEGRRLPLDLDYSAMSGLRLEARDKLATVRPATLGQASRIPGVNPADITVLMILLDSR